MKLLPDDDKCECEPYNPSETAKSALEMAREAITSEFNLEMVPADDQTLQLDLDTPEQLTTFQAHWPMFKDIFRPVGDYRTERSKSGNTHVYISLSRPASAEYRVAMQAALGSDGKRELLNLNRVMSGEPDAICLFRVKPASAEGAEADKTTE